MCVSLASQLFLYSHGSVFQVGLKLESHVYCLLHRLSVDVSKGCAPRASGLLGFSIEQDSRECLVPFITSILPPALPQVLSPCDGHSKNAFLWLVVKMWWGSLISLILKKSED